MWGGVAAVAPCGDHSLDAGSDDLLADGIGIIAPISQECLDPVRARCRASPKIYKVESGFRSLWVIAAGAEVVGAFVGLEEVDEPADQVPEAGYGSLRCLAEHRLEPDEGLLDGIEVGTVGREGQQCCPCRLDQLAHRRALMARQVIHDDDVATAQLGYENLDDIGFEPVAVDRPVEHHRSDHSTHPQAGHQRGRFAMPMREAHPQTLAPGAPAMAAGHVGRGPRFVDEDQTLRIEVELPFEPGAALAQDVGPVLLDRVAGLFCA